MRAIERWIVFLAIGIGFVWIFVDKLPTELSEIVKYVASLLTMPYVFVTILILISVALVFPFDTKRRPQGIQAPTVEVPKMKDEIKAGFDTAAASHSRTVAEEAREEAKEQHERAQFKLNCKRVMNDNIIPALMQIEALLNQNGWQCRLTSNLEKLQVTFEVYRGSTEARLGSLPYISFYADDQQLEMVVYYSPNDDGKGLSLSEITHDAVQREVLTFFRELVK